MFKTIKNTAGSIAQSVSLTFILIPTPSNINIARPPDEINKIRLNFKPISKPNAPSNSKMAVIGPALSNPKRLNSLFIFVDIK